jgi:hypothetical protein
MPLMVGIGMAGSGIALVLMAALGAAAIALLVWALRGRREAVPPTCRGCRYDVSGRPVDSTRCSECGADLSADGAVVTAFCRRRRAWAATAAIVLAVAMAVGVNGARRLPWRAWYVRVAPTPTICWEARKDRSPSGDAYRAEWYHREGASPALIDHLLDLQGDLSVPFGGLSEQLLHEARLPGGCMTDVQRRRFGRQLFAGPLTLSVVPPTRVAAYMVVSITWPNRGLPSGEFIVHFKVAAQVDGPATLPASDLTTMVEYYSGRPLVGFLTSKRWGGDRPLQSGVHQVGLAMRWWVTDTKGRPVRPPADVAISQSVQVLPRIVHVNY